MRVLSTINLPPQQAPVSMARVQIPETLPDLCGKSQRREDPRLKSHIMNPPPPEWAQEASPATVREQPFTETRRWRPIKKQFMVAPPKDISEVTKSHPKGDNDIEFSVD